MFSRSLKSVLSVLIDNSFCRYSVKINDFPILEENDGYPVRVPVPINEWVKAGENVLEAWLKPMPIYHEFEGEKVEDEQFEENAYLKLTLNSKTAGRPAETRIPLGSLNYIQSDQIIPDGLPYQSNGVLLTSTPAWKEEDLDNPDPERPWLNTLRWSTPIVSYDILTKRISLRRSFTLPEEWSEWHWQNGDDIQDHEGTKNVLLRLYRNVHRLFTLAKDGDANAQGQIDAMLRQKYQDYASAYYMTPTQSRMELNWDNLTSGQAIKLHSLDEENLQLRVVANQKLAFLQTQNGESPLFLESTDAWHHITLTYAFIKGEWQLVR